MNGPCYAAKLKLPTGLWCGLAPNSCLNTNLKLFRQIGSKTETGGKWMDSTLTVAALLTCSIMITLYAAVWTFILMLCSRLMPHSLGYLLGCRRDCSLLCGPRFKKHMRQWVGLANWCRSFIYTFSVLTDLFTQSCASDLVEVLKRKSTNFSHPFVILWEIQQMIVGFYCLRWSEGSSSHCCTLGPSCY